MVDLSATASIAPKTNAGYVMLLDYCVRELLTMLAVQAAHLRDGAWLREQRAASVAIPHGVLTDKTFRLLEALSGERTA